MTKERFVLTDLELSDPLCRYFNFKDIKFDFLPDDLKVPLVDVIADRIKGKSDVVLILGMKAQSQDKTCALKQLFDQGSKYNDFKKIRAGLTLIVYQHSDVLLGLIERRDFNFGFREWLNGLKPLIITDGRAGDVLRNDYKDCEFVSQGYPHLSMEMNHAEFATLKNHVPTKDFLCLMIDKPKRDFRHSLHEKIIASGIADNMILRFKQMVEHPFADLQGQFQKKILDGDDTHLLTPIGYYNQTNLELGTESFCSDHDTTYDITEKTLRPMEMKHPFMMFTNKGFMKNLRDLGFQTFHEHLDESYDQEPLMDRRIEIIVKNLTDLRGRSIKLYEDSKEIREHNHLHLQHQAGEWTTKFWTTMDQIWRNI